MSAGHHCLNGDLESQSFHLPKELLLNILETAASQHKDTARTLCSVSRWVREVAVPHLYRTITLRGEYAEDIMKALCVSLPDGTKVSPTHFTRNLWFVAGPGIYQKEHDAIIQFFAELALHFPSVENLTLQGDSYHFLLLASKAFPIATTAKLRLEVLPGDWKYDLFPFTRNLPYGEHTLLERITHLTMHNTDIIPVIDLTCYTQLTHLAIPFNPWKSEDLLSIARAVLSAPNLQMIVLMIPEEWEEIEIDGLSIRDFMQLYLLDSRVHVAPMIYPDQEQWQAVADGEESSIWEEAYTYSKESGFTSWVETAIQDNTDPFNLLSQYSTDLSSLVAPVA